MTFRIRGLSAAPFRHLYGLDSDALAKSGVRRCVVDKKPGFPDRVTMRDAEIGETMLLLNPFHPRRRHALSHGLRDLRPRGRRGDVRRVG